MVNLIDLLHAKLEIFRLEQRYTKRRNRRSTFVSEAQYVDGEYIYSPTSTYSAKCSAGNSSSDSVVEIKASSKDTSSKDESKDASGTAKEAKLGRRMSKMGLEKMEWRKGREERREQKRLSRVVVSEVRWDNSVRA